jgi:copper(I)-binding protein
MRLRISRAVPLPAAVAAVAVAAVGVAGLVRGALPADQAAADPPIVVSGAWVRQPAPPTDAVAAYFTVRNNTDTPDRIVSVRTSAGRSAVLHTYVDGVMTAVASGAVVPAHKALVLSTGKGHLMIEHLRGTLHPGDRVKIDLTFAGAGAIHVSAPVIALGAPAPTSSNGVSK